MAATTLADFARSIGIAPGTARQWKRRGWIAEDGGHFWLVCRACGQKYSGDAGACHVYCSEACAGGRRDDCIACCRAELREKIEEARPNVTLPPMVEGQDGWVVQPGPLYVRSSSGTSPERIAELRKRFESGKLDSNAASCLATLSVVVAALQADMASLVAENTELRDRIGKLEGDVAFLLTRLGHPSPPVILGTASAPERAAALIEAHRQG